MKIPVPQKDEEENLWRIAKGLAPKSVIKKIDDAVLGAAAQANSPVLRTMEESLERNYNTLQNNAVLQCLIYLKNINLGAPLRDNDPGSLHDLCAGQFLGMVDFWHRLKRSQGEKLEIEPLEHARYLGELVVQQMKMAGLIEDVHIPGDGYECEDGHKLTLDGEHYVNLYLTQDYINLGKYFQNLKRARENLHK